MLKINLKPKNILINFFPSQNYNQKMDYKIDSNLILNLTLNKYLDLVGNIEVIDIIYMFVTSSISLIGSIFNFFCIWIFFSKDFTQSFYIHYRILSINSFLHDFFGFFYSLCVSPRYVPTNYQYFCVQVQYAFVPLHLFFFFHSGLIEISILMDRLKIFNKTINKYFKLEPKKISIILFFISFLFGLSGIFIYKPIESTWYNYVNVNSTHKFERNFFYYLGRSDFAQTSVGSIYVATLSTIHNIPLLIITIILNLTLVILMKRHARQSAIRFNNNNSSQAEQKKQKANRRASSMAIVLCSISIISRMVSVIGIISYNLNPNILSQILVSLVDLFILADSGSLFFVCFSFNKIFRGKAKKIKMFS